MSAIAFVLPIVPGKEELDRSTLEEMMGARRDEHEAAMRRDEITRHAAWHQETPDGTVAVVYIEADDPEAAMRGFGSSDEPFNRWFRERMQEVHGIDISGPGLRVEQVLDAQL